MMEPKDPKNCQSEPQPMVSYDWEELKKLTVIASFLEQKFELPEMWEEEAAERLEHRENLRFQIDRNTNMFRVETMTLRPMFKEQLATHV